MLTPDQQIEFMKIALKDAELAAASGEIPVAALIIFEGEIVGRGSNRRLLDFDPSAHAEIVAMRDAGKRLKRWNLTGCDMVVTLEPCAMCSGAIVNSRIDNVYFGAYDLRFGCCGTLMNIANDTRLNHRANTFGGIMQEESLKLLQDFFKARRKKSDT